MSFNQIYPEIVNVGGKNIHVKFQIIGTMHEDYPKKVTLVGFDHKQKRYMATAILLEDGSLKSFNYIKD